MAAIDTSLLPSGNVRFQMAAMPEPTDPLAEEQKRLANQVTAQNLATAKRNAQKQQLTDAMRDVMTHETPEDAIASIDRHVADGTLTPEQAADAKSKVPVRGADGSLPQGSMAAWRQRNFDDYIATNEQLYESQTRRQQQQQMQDIIGMGAAPAPAAPTNALAPAPVDQEQALFNQLNPQPVAPTAAPTNALVSSPAQGVDVNALRRQITQLNMLGTPSALAQARFLETQIPEPVKAPTETEFDKKWKLFKLQYPNGTYEQFEKLSRAPASSTTFNLSPAQTEEQKAHGQQLVSTYGDIKALATTARNQRTTVDIMDKLLTEGFETGFGKEATAKAANVLTSLGIKDAAKYAADAQSFQAAVRQNVLDEQMKQKGVQTEGDAQRIEETSARLGNTTEANKFLVAVRRAQQDRAMAQQKFWDNWWTKNKTYEGAEQAWNEGEGGKSIFDTPALKKYSAAQTNNVRSQADAIIGAKR